MPLFVRFQGLSETTGIVDQATNTRFREPLQAPATTPASVRLEVADGALDQQPHELPAGVWPRAGWTLLDHTGCPNSRQPRWRARSSQSAASSSALASA